MAQFAQGLWQGLAPNVGEFWQGTVADPAWDRTVMTLRLPVKFRRQLTMRLYQSTGAGTTFDLMTTANMVR